MHFSGFIHTKRGNLLMKRAIAILIGAAVLSPLAIHAQVSKPSGPAVPSAQELATMQAKLNVWPQLARYRDANAALPPVAAGEKRVVFYGDSITDAWAKKPEQFFPGRPYVGRGISGQTTPQMLVRFQQDVVHLKP